MQAETTVLVSLSQGAMSRLAICNALLQGPYKRQKSLYPWMRDQLGNLVSNEPGRPGTHVLRGALRMLQSKDKASVLKAWKRAQQLDPHVTFEPWTAEFRKTFGDSPELRALLEPPASDSDDR